MNFAPIIAAAVSFDVDLTAVYMALLFVVFYYLFKLVLVNDYLKARDLRRDAVEGAREEATESQALADARIAEFEDEMKAARREAAEVRESMRTQGTAEQHDLLAEARAEIQALLAEERQKIAEQVSSAELELQSRARTLSNAIVDKILPSVG